MGFVMTVSSPACFATATPSVTHGRRGRAALVEVAAVVLDGPAAVIVKIFAHHLTLRTGTRGTAVLARFDRARARRPLDLAKEDTVDVGIVDARCASGRHGSGVRTLGSIGDGHIVTITGVASIVAIAVLLVRIGGVGAVVVETHTAVTIGVLAEETA